MKKVIAVLLMVILMVSCFAGCGEKRALYSGIDMSKYVEVKDYLGIKVDTKGDQFAEYYNDVLTTDMQDNSLYKEVKDGTVKDGDTINLDYSGKIDGVVFDGGTAEGQELVIGSNSFIDDFEEELIGAKVGETRDVTAKFPDDYSNSPDLAGKEAVFTCTINYIKAPMTEEEAYKEMDFDSAKDYKENITERAVKNYILNVVCKSAKIKDYPENDTAILTDAMFEVYIAQ
ncbi:MAG: FKBP-type peptidyl-prolyl cis-trans isomerase, partial [Clostridia bacterium]|nr:FKBP-type peptidyl-prolyl cis-trans isomerase [Clostridia bacterium]